jgi:two-component system, NtrC family, sensor kinase
MTSIRLSRRAWLVVAAVGLVGALVFLFVKTDASRYRDASQALARLRELKDVDMRWDLDALRLANGLSAPAPFVPDRGPIIARILQELDQPGTRDALGPRLATIRAGIVEKQQAFGALRSRHADSLKAIASVGDAFAAFVAEVPAARARDPRAAQAGAALVSQAERILAALRTADIESHGDLERAVEARLATLAPMAQGVDPRLANAAARGEQVAREFLRARGAESEAWRRFAFLTAGARIEMASQDLSKAIATALEERDRWRAYLAAYAAALLVGLGYLAARLLAADAALRTANEQLERRVAERTAELTRALRQLKESEAQLVQTEKMSSLGQLVAGVAHEINTPLAYVKSNVTGLRDRVPELRQVVQGAAALLALLRKESPPPDELERAFAGISAHLDHLFAHGVLEDLDALTHDGLHGIEQISELVANLRSFSRLDRSRIASFNVNESVKAAFLIARPILRKVDVEKLMGDVPAITCSPSQVNQVVLNLVTNAVQAIDKPRGHIVARTRREGDDAVAIEIADNGRGIAPEHLTRIFDPFFTTKAPGSGTGLGLSIAYKIVAQHGGRIDVRSQPGEGSTFTVILPLDPPPEPLDASLPDASPEAARP